MDHFKRLKSYLNIVNLAVANIPVCSVFLLEEKNTDRSVVESDILPYLYIFYYFHDAIDEQSNVLVTDTKKIIKH